MMMNYPKLLHLVLLFLLIPLGVQAERTVLKDIPFASIEGKDLMLDLYLPEEAENPPLVLWIHGGGWSGGNKKWCHVKWLTDHGFAVASTSYRLSQHAKFPAQIHDVKAAVRWLRAHAESYGYDPERIAVAGESAGGHLAALLGVSGGVKALEGDIGEDTGVSSRVSAVVNYFGASDFILRSKTQPSRADMVGSVVYNLLGGPASVLKEQAVLASPAFHVTPNDPPMLILHGVKDNTVLIDQAVRLFEAYIKAGLPVEFIAPEELGHGGDAFYEGLNREVVLEFLKRHL